MHWWIVEIALVVVINGPFVVAGPYTNKTNDHQEADEDEEPEHPCTVHFGSVLE